MTRVMRPDRTYFDIDDGIAPHIHRQMLAELGYVQAKDGVWLPKCDIEQYHRGERLPVTERGA